MKTVLASVLSMVILSGMVTVQAITPEKPAFTLPKLPYAYNALEPAIDATTMETHVTKHHQAYVDKLNGEAVKNPKLKTMPLEQVVKNVSNFNTTVRNNAGGHWNHSFFWTEMAPADKTGSMSPTLEKAIVESFGSVDAFKTAFEKAGVDRFGSGWVWLVVNPDNKLQIVSTPNQDNPLMDVAEVHGKPILGNDLWEHAYYLKYKNKRADYLKSWWSVVNWTQISKNYETALK